MYLKEFSANWLFQFQFLQICFRIRPKLSCLRMIHKLILYFFRLARSKHLSCNFFPSLIQKQTDSCRSSLLRSTDTRTEQYVGQRIKPHIHTDDIGRNNTGIGSIDGDSSAFNLSESSRVKATKPTLYCCKQGYAKNFLSFHEQKIQE